MGVSFKGSIVNYPKIEKPTEPGWYWAKSDSRWCVVEMRERDWSDESGESWVERECYETGEDCPNEIDCYTDWRGPLPEPANA